MNLPDNKFRAKIVVLVLHFQQRSQDSLQQLIIVLIVWTHLSIHFKVRLNDHPAFQQLFFSRTVLKPEIVQVVADNEETSIDTTH